MIPFSKDRIHSIHEKYESDSWTTYECDAFALTDKFMLLIYRWEEKSDIPHFHLHLRNDFEHCICRIQLPMSLDAMIKVYPCDDDRIGFSRLSDEEKVNIQKLLEEKSRIYGKILSMLLMPGGIMLGDYRLYVNV